MNETATTTTANDSALQDLGRCLTALGDPTRQQIMMLLSRQRLNVGELAERFRLSRPAVSHQIKVLLHAGLLIQEREGRERVYRVDTARCRGFVDRLQSFMNTCCSGKACC